MIRFSYGAVLGNVSGEQVEGKIPADFFDEGSDGFGFGGKNSPSAGWSGREFTATDDVALVHADGNAYYNVSLVFQGQLVSRSVYHPIGKVYLNEEILREME